MSESTEAPTTGTGSYTDGPTGLAYRALLEHTRDCDQCVDDVRQCATGRALVRTLKDAARRRG